MPQTKENHSLRNRSSRPMIRIEILIIDLCEPKFALIKLEKCGVPY